MGVRRRNQWKIWNYLMVWITLYTKHDIRYSYKYCNDLMWSKSNEDVDTFLIIITCIYLCSTRNYFMVETQEALWIDIMALRKRLNIFCNTTTTSIYINIWYVLYVFIFKCALQIQWRRCGYWKILKITLLIPPVLAVECRYCVIHLRYSLLIKEP